jgi:DNA-binding MarR family transcriptional regulator
MARVDSRTEAGAALMRVIAATLQASFKLRALGRRNGFVSARGGVWGVLRSLKDGGPQTVPALARAQPVSRQHMQMLADSMAADGLVAFKANPAHRRSQLVAITPQGERVLDALTKRLAAISDELAAGLNAKKLAASAEILARLGAKLDEALGEPREEPEPARRRRIHSRNP